jgi:hypothetical protein
MNQLGGVGAGGIPGRSYAFAPGADGVSRNLSICEKSYCRELDNITLTNEELLFLAKTLQIDTEEDLQNYLMKNFYTYSPNLVRKLEIYKNLYLKKSKNSNMNLNQFYNIPYNNIATYSYSFIMSKISNDKSYKYNESSINEFENIIDTVDNTGGSTTTQQKDFLYNINNEINFWKEIFRYLHWYICK